MICETPALLTRAVNATRFIRSAHFSRLLQHVAETIDSLTIVRVFGMTQRYYERMCLLADQNLRVSLASVTCSRLTRTFAMACSQTMVLATLFLTVAVGGGVVDEYEKTSRSSSIGLTLNSSLAAFGFRTAQQRVRSQISSSTHALLVYRARKALSGILRSGVAKARTACRLKYHPEDFSGLLVQLTAQQAGILLREVQKTRTPAAVRREQAPASGTRPPTSGGFKPARSKRHPAP
ncbi:hypothetical protein HPB51_003065 [Rhipicephalus microplus]|uniref:Uncharacterized protein n=1 Tax=Rhipicephalus microplus TaxID=6941 RepID=A0A9J6E5T6_RHIMP|nr:hypothetical protein HPB51_003065 [Rhipicephalus microplus]